MDDVAEIVGISYEHVHHTLTQELGMKNVVEDRICTCCIFRASSVTTGSSGSVVFWSVQPSDKSGSVKLT